MTHRLEGSHAALADQSERLNCLIASAIPGVLITDERGTVTNVSRSFGTMFGLDEPAHPGRHLRRLGAAPHRGACSPIPVPFTRRAVAVYRARQPMTGEQIRRADGRTVEWDYWPVLVDGRYSGDIWLAWDMSDRAELEQQRVQMLEAELAARQLAEQAQRQLAEQNERLRKIDEARNQFLAIVSHELRTPLTSIISFSELIRGEAEGLTPDGVRFLDIIERNADRLHRLVGDLLMLDRLEAGALPLDLAPVSVADLAAEAVGSASAGAARQGVTVEVSDGPRPGRARRPPAADAGAGQPDRERRQVLAPRPAGARHGRVRRQPLADRRGRHRDRHPPGRGRAALHPVRPRLQRAHRRAAGNRPGPVHRQGARRDARRARGGGQHPGPRQHVQRLPAGADA